MSDEEFDNYNFDEDEDSGGGFGGGDEYGGFGGDEYGDEYGGEDEDLEAEGDGGYGSGMEEDDEDARPDYGGTTFGHAEMDAFNRLGPGMADPWLEKMMDYPKIFRTLVDNDQTMSVQHLKYLREQEINCSKGSKSTFTFNNSDMIRSLNPVATALGFYVRDEDGTANKKRMKEVGKILKTMPKSGNNSNINLGAVFRYMRMWNRLYNKNTQVEEEDEEELDIDEEELDIDEEDDEDEDDNIELDIEEEEDEDTTTSSSLNTRTTPEEDEQLQAALEASLLPVVGSGAIDDDQQSDPDTYEYEYEDEDEDEDE